MDAKFLLAALFVASPPATAGAAAPVEIFFPSEVLVTAGESSHGDWVEIRTSEPRPGADVEMRLDATGAASIAKVTTDTEGCLTEANVITCHRKMDVDQDSGSVALIRFTSQAEAGRAQVTVTATVNGVFSGFWHTVVIITEPPKLTLMGTKVKAPGQTRVKVRVGIKNAGQGPANLPPITPNMGSVTHYIHFPSDTLAESVTEGQCFPWGPWPDGWGWEHPNESSYKYACATGPIQAGAITWYEITIRINPQRRLVTGYISWRDGATTPEMAAPIVIDTRDTLPVTGSRAWDYAIGAVALIVPGIVLLLVVIRRPRRTNREPDTLY